MSKFYYNYNESRERFKRICDAMGVNMNYEKGTDEHCKASAIMQVADYTGFGDVVTICDELNHKAGILADYFNHDFAEICFWIAEALFYAGDQIELSAAWLRHLRNNNIDMQAATFTL